MRTLNAQLYSLREYEEFVPETWIQSNDLSDKEIRDTRDTKIYKNVAFYLQSLAADLVFQAENDKTYCSIKDFARSLIATARSCKFYIFMHLLSFTMCTDLFSFDVL